MSGFSVAVIGTGVAGLTAARTLEAAGCAVTLFDKARGPGGRLASRRRDGFSFDFGAQFFTARDPRFAAEVSRLRRVGIVQPWHARFAEIEHSTILVQRRWGDDPPHFVATGRMTRLAAHWAEGLNVLLSRRIIALRREGDTWYLTDEAGNEFGPHDSVIVALPAKQTADLLPLASDLRRRAGKVGMVGCYALMLGFDIPIEAGFDAALVRRDMLGWLSVSQSRPAHDGGAGLVALSSNTWAEAHMETEPDTVRAAMMARLRAIVPALPMPVHTDLHRWRYANCSPEMQCSPWIDAPIKLAVCGDWTRHGRIEAAYLSGLETAQLCLERF